MYGKLSLKNNCFVFMCSYSLKIIISLFVGCLINDILFSIERCYLARSKIFEYFFFVFDNDKYEITFLETIDCHKVIFTNLVQS